MPQLDQILYFSQVCWLIITFIILYTCFLKDYMPFIFKIKKIRKEKVANHYSLVLFFSYVSAEVLYSRWVSLRKIII